MEKHMAMARHCRRGLCPGKTDRKMKKLRFFVVAALLAVLWAPASGQNYRSFRDELNDVTTRAKLRVGPLRILPKLQLQNLGYDNTVYYRRRDENPVGDYTGTVSPELRGYLLLGRSLILSFTENPEYLYFATETRLGRSRTAMPQACV
jgi:hypothetical protein